MRGCRVKSLSLSLSFFFRFFLFFLYGIADVVNHLFLNCDNYCCYYVVLWIRQEKKNLSCLCVSLFICHSPLLIHFNFSTKNYFIILRIFQ